MRQDLNTDEFEWDEESEKIDKKFEDAFRRAGYTSPVFTHAAKQQMGKMVEQIARSNENYNARLSGDLTSARKGGFMSEEYHTESFNLDAILKDKDTRAYTDQYKTEWAEQGRAGNDGVADIINVEDGKTVHTAQSKYYDDPAKTGGSNKGFSTVDDGRPKYGDADTYLAPSDQVSDIKKGAGEKAAGESDPVKRDAYRQTEKKTSGKLKHGEVESSELTKSEADSMGRGDMSKVRKTESEYQTKSTVLQMKRAAVGAAAISAVVSGTVNTVRYIQLASEGKISADEAVVKIVAETAASAADSAVKASAVVGTQSLMVRYGAEKVVIGALAKSGFNALVRTNAVTVGVVCGIDMIKDMVALGMGNLTKEEFCERQGKNVLNTTAGVTGGALGAIAAESAFVGATGLLATAAPFLGGLAGGLIAGLAMNMAIENGVEKPYRELVSNTSALVSAARELEMVSRNVFGAQVIFTKVIERDIILERLTANQMDRIDAAGRRALEVIEKI